MYRPDKYDVHDVSLNHFAELFNHCSVMPHITICPNENETFGNDGYICVNSIRVIGFDWEKRDRYFKSGVLQFSTLGQYERKLHKGDLIKIALQCDEDETSVAVGWHEDWLREMVENRELLTSYAKKQNGQTRYTKYYQIFSYQNLGVLKIAIAKAIYEHNFTYSSFNIKNANIDALNAFAASFTIEQCYHDYKAYALDASAQSPQSSQPAPAAKPENPVCPHCGAVLDRKPGKYGKSDFYACPNFNNGCKGYIISVNNV